MKKNSAVGVLILEYIVCNRALTEIFQGSFDTINNFDTPNKFYEKL